MTLDELVGLDRAGLADVFASGRPVCVDDLVDGPWRGVALGSPAWVRRLTWTKFVKVVERTPSGAVGHNRAVAQDALDRPWVERRILGRPVRYGSFAVRGTDRAWLDYGRAHDPLVWAADGLILGVTDVRVGGRSVRTPTWFALLPPYR